MSAENTQGTAGPPAFSVGVGYDVHRLTAGRKLVLGGVDIPFDRGLAGHSDADVLLHAVCDALLGAAGMPDIGVLFPPDDPAYEGACSLDLLREVVRRLHDDGFVVQNVDVTLVAEGAVSVKATTNEGLGWIGSGEGMAAIAVAALARYPG